MNVPSVAANTTLYSSARVGIKHAEVPDESNQLEYGQSRAGMTVVSQFGSETEAGRDAIQIEVGPSSTLRTLRASLGTPIGLFSIGRQWSTAYSMIGQFADVAIFVDGETFEGESRTDSIQYAKENGEWFAQFETGEGGPSVSYQVGVARDLGASYASLFVDKSHQPASSTLKELFRAGQERPVCAARGVDCYGVAFGGDVDALSLNASMQVYALRSERASSWSVGSSWAPTQYSALVQYGRFGGVAARSVLVGRVGYRWNMRWQAFAELVDVDGEKTGSSITVGFRYDLVRHY